MVASLGLDRNVGCQVPILFSNFFFYFFNFSGRLCKLTDFHVLLLSLDTRSVTSRSVSSAQVSECMARSMGFFSPSNFLILVEFAL